MKRPVQCIGRIFLIESLHQPEALESFSALNRISLFTPQAAESIPNLSH